MLLVFSLRTVLVINTCILCIFCLHTAGATLIFHVELLELKKKSLVSIPQGNGFYLTLGVVALLILGGYEIYKRYNKQSDESSTVTSKKSGKKGKRDKKR